MSGPAPVQSSDDVVVLRGGEMKRDPTVASATVNFHRCGIYALSVWSMPSMTAEEMVRAIRTRNPEDLKHGKIRTSTRGRLQTAGFGLIEHGPNGHCSLTLPTPPADGDWEALEGAFDIAVERPAKGEV